MKNKRHKTKKKTENKNIQEIRKKNHLLPTTGPHQHGLLSG